MAAAASSANLAASVLAPSSSTSYWSSQQQQQQQSSSSNASNSSNSSFENNAVVKDLLAALGDAELHDTTIVASDGTPIKASRFVLAARSMVFKKMLYGNFLESTSSTVNLEYTAEVLQAALEYCATNDIEKFAKAQCLVPPTAPQEPDFGNGAADAMTIMMNSTTTSSTTSTAPTKSTFGGGGSSASHHHFELSIRSTNSPPPVSAVAVRKLVQLAKLGDFLGLVGLQRKSERLVRSVVTRYPSLACPVYDEAAPESDIQLLALQMIECRPYVALLPNADGEGGIECLDSHSVLELVRNPNIKTGELFLFEMVLKWVEAPSLGSSSGSSAAAAAAKLERRRIAQEAARYLELDNIEPQELLSKVKTSGLVELERIQEAITLQALRASQDRVWSISCRGPRPDVDRVLVEGAGCPNVNGIYYRIMGLAHGELYSKREVTCGQPYVYTLSLTYNPRAIHTAAVPATAAAATDSNKNKSSTISSTSHSQQQYHQVECRMFCSKLLTHRALCKFKKMKNADPNFQPVLQIIDWDTPEPLVTSRMYLSDGEHYIQSTMSPDVYKLVKRKEVMINSVIKVLDMGKYKLDGRSAVHLNKISVVSTDTGHRFGHPINIQDRAAVKVSLTKPDHGGLLKLYSNHFAQGALSSSSVSSNSVVAGSKIPRTGWRVECHGTSPGPTCTWIPTTTATATLAKGRRAASQRHWNKNAATSSPSNNQLESSSDSSDDDDEHDTPTAANAADWSFGS